MKHIIKALLTWFLLFILGFPILLILIAVVGKPVTTIVRSSLCKINGKKYLTLTNGDTVCVKKFNDAGKYCTNPEECQGYCLASENKCSEYPLAKYCYEEFHLSAANPEIFHDTNGRLTILLCPPVAFR